MCVNMYADKELSSLCVGIMVINLLSLDEHTNICISLTILVWMSLLEQLLSSEEHEWKEDTRCVCMYLFVSGGFTLHQMDSVALIPLFSHTQTHRARTSVCVCLPNVWGNACVCMSEMISVHCYLSEREWWEGRQPSVMLIDTCCKIDS